MVFDVREAGSNEMFKVINGLEDFDIDEGQLDWG